MGGEEEGKRNQSELFKKKGRSGDHCYATKRGGGGESSVKTLKKAGGNPETDRGRKKKKKALKPSPQPGIKGKKREAVPPYSITLCLPSRKKELNLHSSHLQEKRKGDSLKRGAQRPVCDGRKKETRSSA